MKLLRGSSRNRLRIAVVCWTVILIPVSACRPGNSRLTSECVFKPCTEMNLYKEEVVYRLLYLQNALLHGSQTAYHSYDATGLRKRIDELFVAHAEGELWQDFQRRFKDFWDFLPGTQDGLGDLEWIQRNLDLLCAAYAFEILPFDTRKQLYPLIANLMERKQELADFWNRYRHRLPGYLENPRVNQLRSVEKGPVADWASKLRQGKPVILAHRVVDFPPHLRTAWKRSVRPIWPDRTGSNVIFAWLQTGKWRCCTMKISIA